jgi:hypothetical protein
MSKIIKVKDRPLDGLTPSMSISRSMYQSGLDKLREQARREKLVLITNSGVEDYREPQKK